MQEATPKSLIKRPSAPQADDVVVVRSHRWRSWLAWTLCILIAAAAIHYGMQLRRWAWESTTDVRFVNSVSNAIEWGRYANEVGVLKVYDVLVEKHGLEGDYSGPARFALDYAPLRLFIASQWADWAQQKFPPPAGKPLVWRPEYEFTEPMLKLNLACELLGSFGMFLLVYHWVRVTKTEAPRRWWAFSFKNAWGRDEAPTKLLPSTVGLFTAMTAALLLWFNPAVIFNAHVYPQWDVWLLPPFIFALYFGMRNWWLPAGIAVGLCAMAKGQIFFALPLLIAWPLLLGNLAGVVRVLVGIVVGIALAVWPFLLQSYDASKWIVFASAGAVLLSCVVVMPRSGWKWRVARCLVAIIGLCVIAWPVAAITGEFALHGTEVVVQKRATLLTFLALAAIAAILGGRRWVPTLLAGVPAVCTLLTIPLLSATSAWFEVGTIYPTRHWKQLFWCHGANLGSLLQVRFRWAYRDVVDLSWIPVLNLTEPVLMRHFMTGIYVILLALLLVALVRHRRWHDPKLLLVFAVPFMLSYTFLPQMIERYLIWPAAILSAYAAMNLGALALWLGVSLIACALMFGYMLTFVRNTPTSREWLPLVQPLFPDIGWAVIALALVMLYMAFVPTRHTSAPRLPAE